MVMEIPVAAILEGTDVIHQPHTAAKTVQPSQLIKHLHRFLTVMLPPGEIHKQHFANLQLWDFASNPYKGKSPSRN